MYAKSQPQQAGGGTNSENELLTKLGRQERHLAAIKAIAMAVSQLDQPDTLLAKALNAMLDITELEIGAIWLFDHLHERLTLTHQQGLPAGMLAGIENLKAGPSLPELIAQSGEIFSDTKAPPDTEWARKAGLRFLVGIPLRSKTRVVGSMILGTQTDRGLSAEEIELLADLGLQIGVAVENAQMHWESQIKLQRQAVFAEVAATLFGSPNLDEVLQQAAAKITAGTGMSGCSISLWDSWANTMTLLAQYVDPQLGKNLPSTSHVGRPISLDNLPAMQKILSAKSPFIIKKDNPDITPAERQRLELHGWHNLLGFPLILGYQVLGLLELYSATEQEHPLEMIRFCQSLANQIAMAVHNQLLYTQVQDQAVSMQKLAEQLQIISAVSLRMQQAATVEEGLQAVGNGLQELGFYCAMLLLDADHKHFTLRYTNWMPALAQAVQNKLGFKITDMVIPLDQIPPLHEVIKKQERVWVEDAAQVLKTIMPQAPQPLLQQLTRQIRFGRGLGLPMIGRVGIIGTMAVWAEELDPDDATALAILARQTAESIETVQLLTKTQEQLQVLQIQTEQITAVSEIAGAILSQLDIGSVATMALERAQQIIPDCQAAYIVLPDPQQETVTVFASSPDFPSGTFPLHHFRFHRHTYQGQLVHHPDAQPPAHAPILARQLAVGVRSHLAFPLLVHGKLVGSLDLVSQEPNAFKPEAINVGQEIARHLAVAVENARLYAEQERQVNELSALYRTSLGMAEAQSLEESLQIMLNQSRKLLGADCGIVFLRNELSQGLEPLVSEGMEQDTIDHWLGLVEQLSSRPVGLALPPRATQAGEQILGVPLVWNDQSLGALMLGRTSNQRFGPEQSRQLTLFGAQAASTIQSAQLYLALERSRLRLKALVERLIAAEEEERRLLAYDLHDGLTQDIIAADLQLQSYKFLKQTAPEAAEEALARGLAALQKSVVEARRLIADLGPAGLDELGLVTSVDNYARDMGTTAGWAVDFKSSHFSFGFSQPQQIAIYRIVQEALTNIRKHAETKRISISLEKIHDRLEIAIQDWGKGFDPSTVDSPSPNGGVGLTAMRERASLLGGQLEISSRPGSGTTVRVTIPLDRQKDRVSP